MEPPPTPAKAPSSTQLFQVFLRLRPPHTVLPSAAPTSLYPQLPGAAERFLTVEPPSPTTPSAPSEESAGARPTHITIRPPRDSRKRAVEKFGFTEVFEEPTSQLEVFSSVGVEKLVAGVLHEGRDALLATLGVTGSGKSHTILGSKSQRGLTQLSLDLLFRALHGRLLQPGSHPDLFNSLAAQDASEAHVCGAQAFLENAYGDGMRSRAATPLTVGPSAFYTADSTSPLPSSVSQRGGLWDQWDLLGLRGDSEGREPVPKDSMATKSPANPQSYRDDHGTARKEHGHLRFAPWDSPRFKNVKAKLQRSGAPRQQEITSTFCPPTPGGRRVLPLPRPSTLPSHPDLGPDVPIPHAPSDADYAVLVSMYEVYNDRIFDLLALAHAQTAAGPGKEARRRPLLFKATEASRERKVVAGLRKVACATYEEALLVLEAGLTERRVAGTGSNSVSSRSHGFFCVEVRRCARGSRAAWSGAQMTIVDLAGSERARNAKTAGATLAEAGKINESLMYLGHCLQMQSDSNDGIKPSIVPFRQCKLTELLFSNSFPSPHLPLPAGASAPARHNPQRGVMIVAADPLGDFNATSQILRYAALAREVTVPRIPSVADMVFNGVPPPVAHERKPSSGGGAGGDPELAAQLEAEAGRLGVEVEILAVRLAEERERRRVAEEGWRRAEERAEEVEMEVREECWAEAERKIVEERRRWMDARDEEADRNDEHLDRKLDIMARTFQIHEDEPAAESSFNRLEELEDENATLRAKLESLEREVLNRSPTRAATKDTSSLLDRMSSLKVEDKENRGGVKINQGSPRLPDGEVAALKQAKTPGRKIRKLTPKTNIGAWIEDDEDANVFWGTP